MGDNAIEDLVLLRHYFLAKRNKKEAEKRKKTAENEKKSNKTKSSEDVPVVNID